MSHRGDVVTVEEADDPHTSTVTVRGRLDVHSAADVRLELHRVVAGGSTPLLLDLAEARIGDSTGFGVVVEFQRRAHRAGRPVRVVAADDRTRRLLRRAGLGWLLDVAPVAVEVGDAARAGAAEPRPGVGTLTA